MSFASCSHVSPDVSRAAIAPGTLWGVGVGTGDPELLTLKAVRLLQTTPVVAFPAGRQGRPGVAQSIIQNFVRSEQTQVPLYFPYVQDDALLATAWQQAAATVGDILLGGQDVVFVTEGDASFYSTFSYLAKGVRDRAPQVAIHTIPGICSPLAAAAQVGEPLTLLAQRLLVLPALYTVADLETSLDHAEVVVLMKVASVYRQVWQILQQRHLLAHSYVVVRATHPDQMIYTHLENWPNLELPYFSLLVINQGRLIR